MIAPTAKTPHSLVVIPSRLKATRLPDKPLADLCGVPMIVHVWRRALAAKIGPVIVAAADEAIAQAIRQAGGEAVLTDPDHPSGSDRVCEAVRRYDPQGRFEAIVNVQGDLPTIDPTIIRAVFAPLAKAKIDIATLVCAIVDPAERDNPNVVKAVAAIAEGQPSGPALYFTRATAPWGEGPLYHHIGLYAFRRAALERFVSLPQGILEQREKLEQLRALEHGMKIEAVLVETIPLGVDTPQDLDRARLYLSAE